jgi:hypothetical protein
LRASSSALEQRVFCARCSGTTGRSEHRAVTLERQRVAIEALERIALIEAVERTRSLIERSNRREGDARSASSVARSSVSLPSRGTLIVTTSPWLRAATASRTSVVELIGSPSRSGSRRVAKARACAALPGRTPSTSTAVGRRASLIAPVGSGSTTATPRRALPGA